MMPFAARAQLRERQKDSGASWHALIVLSLLMCEPAQAFSYDLSSIFFFGDSLTDEGRNGRTAPIMWPGVVRSDLAVSDGRNYAIGGAFTSNNSTITGADTSLFRQIGEFAADGGAPNAKSAAAIWIGTNNIWQGASRGSSAVTVALSAASDVLTGISTLRANGVSSVIVLGVYDLSLTNAYQGAGTDTIDVRNSAAASSFAYNSQLAQYAASNSDIEYFNIANYINYMQLHPDIYGFTQVLPLQQGQVCDASCQQSSIFADTIHLSSKAQKLIGDYVAGGNPVFNRSPFVYGAIADNVMSVRTLVPMSASLVNESALDFAEEVFRLNAELHRPGPERRAAETGVRSSELSGITAYASANGGYVFDTKRDGTPNTAYSIFGLTSGFSVTENGNIHVGGVFNYQRLQTDMSESVNGQVNLNAINLALVSTGRISNFYWETLAGFGVNSFSVDRSGSFGHLQAAPSGMTYFAAARTGYLSDFAGLQAGPVFGLSWVRSSINAYSESGDFYSRSIVGQQDLSWLTGSWGVELKPKIGADNGVSTTIALTYEHDFDQGPQQANVSFAYLPTQSIATLSNTKKDSIKFKVDLNYEAAQNIDFGLSAFASATTDRDWTAGVRASAAFRF